METTFMIRFKKQPDSFKKCIKRYGKNQKWYEPNVAVKLYQEIIENSEVDGELEVELKCLASGKRIVNVRFEIDRNQALDVLIHNILQDEKEMGTYESEELTHLLEDFRHAFKWDEKEHVDVEEDQVLDGEAETINSKSEKSEYDEQPKADQCLIDSAEEENRKLEIEPELFEDLEDDWIFDESILGSTSGNETDVDAFNGNHDIQNLLDISELSSIALMRNKMAEVEEMAQNGVDHLLEVFCLTDKTDPISISKRKYIEDNYVALFSAFLKKEYKCYAKQKQAIEIEAQKQLNAKSRDIQSESYELIEKELESVRLELETTFNKKKQAEIQKLEKMLEQEFEEALHNHKAEIEKEILSDLTPEQVLLMKDCHDEVELMIKTSADVAVDENGTRYQEFIDGVTTDLQLNQLEFEREQDRLEFKRMQDKFIQAESASKENQKTQLEIMITNQEEFQKQMMNMMQKKEVEVSSKASAGMLVFYMSLVAMILFVFGYLLFRLDFVKEVIGFLD